jgi:hypothetical protein
MFKQEKSCCYRAPGGGKTAAIVLFRREFIDKVSIEAKESMKLKQPN